jgi:hypothetical protein
MPLRTNKIMNTRGIALACLALTGCAKIPPGGSSVAPKLLRVSFVLRGEVQLVEAGLPYYYFVTINRTDNPAESGPVPVVDRPWGNGFAAANATSAQGFVGFVAFNYRGPGFGVYSCETNGVLNNPVTGIFTPLGLPYQTTPVARGSKVISFQVDLNTLPNKTLRYVQLNIIATNNVPQGAEDAPKLWDALGDGTSTGSLNQFITLDTAQNQLRRNSDDRREPTQNDVRDHVAAAVDEPNLDIVDWEAEYRN